MGAVAKTQRCPRSPCAFFTSSVTNVTIGAGGVTVKPSLRHGDVMKTLAIAHVTVMRASSRHPTVDVDRAAVPFHLMEACMFQTLIESRSTRTRSFSGSMISIAAHAGIVGALVVATAQATVPRTAERRETEVKFTVAPPKLPPAVPVEKRVYTVAPVAKGFAVLRPPIDIPTSLPAIDLTLPPTDLNNYTGVGKPGGIGAGMQGATGVAPTEGTVFLESQVEKPVMMLPGTSGPTYPESLRAAGIEGHVMAQFVVDTTGRVDLSSITIVESENPLFSAAVRSALSRTRYLPAEAHGGRVAQLVQQSFQFTVRRD